MLAIPYGRQDVAADDIEAVIAVLRSDWLTQGPTVPRFETALATYCGARHAVAVNSATAALHIACRALGLGAGDRLWTSPNTFVASANCALYCGAEVDFVDIDPRTFRAPRTIAVLSWNLLAPRCDGHFLLLIWRGCASFYGSGALLRALWTHYSFRLSSVTSRRML
jgi:hypothetical protein